ncbi:hypothetical protein RF11_16469 [Thelohanellus kitauei]|uniref:Integrase catalytic domain-containing protein n=1 Tax=Thelohanellus kitauei TaxID=669202 RepID=A0A0C2N452_THEKT|nr:hypothetical protein RF11_16469 [Thelohanellus kitauei]
MGTQFESTLIAHLGKLLKINKTHTTLYHPSGNGKVERSNRTINEALRSYLNAFKNDCIRVAKNSSTNVEPSLLVYGRTVKTIIDTKLTPCPANENFENYHVYVQKLKNAIKLQDKITAEYLRSTNEGQKYYHATSSSNYIYCPENRVFMHNRNQGKLDDKFDGLLIEQEKYPYYILNDPVCSYLSKNGHHDLLFRGNNGAGEPISQDEREDPPSVGI